MPLGGKHERQPLAFADSAALWGKNCLPRPAAILKNSEVPLLGQWLQIKSFF